MTYIDNAAHAHLLAAERLAPDAAHAGQAYFIAQADSIRLWDWINALLERLELPRVERRISERAAYAAGAVLESIWRMLARTDEPRMTRFLALQLARSHSYTLAPAERDFGYREQVSMADATERLTAHLREAQPALSR